MSHGPGAYERYLEVTVRSLGLVVLRVPEPEVLLGVRESLLAWGRFAGQELLVRWSDEFPSPVSQEVLR